MNLRIDLPIFDSIYENAILTFDQSNACFYGLRLSLPGRLYNFSFRSSSAASKASFLFSRADQNPYPSNQDKWH